VRPTLAGCPRPTLGCGRLPLGWEGPYGYGYAEEEWYGEYGGEPGPYGGWETYPEASHASPPPHDSYAEWSHPYAEEWYGTGQYQDRYPYAEEWYGTGEYEEPYGAGDYWYW